MILTSKVFEVMSVYINATLQSFNSRSIYVHFLTCGLIVAPMKQALLIMVLQTYIICIIICWMRICIKRSWSSTAMV